MMYMHLQKAEKLRNKIVFIGVLKISDEKGRIRIRIGSISQRRGSADLDPDPYKNVTDPQEWFKRQGKAWSS
jgi:hypothetical protein